MGPKILLSCLLTVLLIQCNSQGIFHIHRKRLTPSSIDTTTENIFIYEVPNAILYYKQKDILEFINNPENKSTLTNYGYACFQDTLSKRSKSIKIKDILFSYTQIQRDSIIKNEQIGHSNQKLNEEFYFIGAELILKGNFMIYSKRRNKFITERLIARRKKGLLGQKTLEFYLPDKKVFYYIITTLGE